MPAREQRLIAHPGGDQQAPTDAYFSEVADYWGEVYAQAGLQGLVYRERLETVLAWVDALRLPSGAEVLEVGCGAGVATVALARRRLAVESTDSSPDMVARTADRVAAAGLAGAVRLGTSDAHDLPHAGGRFALVVAVGVLPWLHSPERAISELARVLAPGGHAIVTADNRWRLNALVEPVQSPLVGPLGLLWHVVRPRHRAHPRPRRGCTRPGAWTGCSATRDWRRPAAPLWDMVRSRSSDARYSPTGLGSASISG